MMRLYTRFRFPDTETILLLKKTKSKFVIVFSSKKAKLLT